ncbi:MAG TPA: hypothetical protein DCW87_11195 [Comamonadaceae bacterium]|nr:hypothetical protein [Comamonadaceae bacterium]
MATGESDTGRCGPSTRCAQQLHKAQLVLGLEPRAQVHMAQPLCQGGIVQRLQFSTGDGGCIARSPIR